MIFVMLDLDMGMNEWLIEPFKWDDSKVLDHGKVMTADMLEADYKRELGRHGVKVNLVAVGLLDEGLGRELGGMVRLDFAADGLVCEWIMKLE